jgi:Zn-dependent peptidase ImmA (M78 family)
VAGFRLKLATQTGEKIARDEGFTSLPVKPLIIAERKDLHVEKKPPGMKGISGALIFMEPKPLLIYSSEHQNAGFENFSIAHELGHYCLPDHPDQILQSGGQHFSRAGFSEGSLSIELEADHFAAGLLMPDFLVRKLIEESEVGLESIRELAGSAEVSLTAAAIRVAQCARFPICIVVSEGATVRYAFPSESFKDLGRNIFLPKGTALPGASTTARFNALASNVALGRQATGECRLRDWFDTDRNPALDEQVVGLGSYGLTLTVLSSDELGIDPGLDEEDEEAALEENWTPRFARGR